MRIPILLWSLTGYRQDDKIMIEKVKEKTTPDGNESTKDGSDEGLCQNTGSEEKEKLEDLSFSKIKDLLSEHLLNKDQSDYEQFKARLEVLLTRYAEEFCKCEDVKKYHIVFLWTKYPLSEFHLDQIHRRLKKNPKSKEGYENDILLIIDSHGGSIEPAFKISKICNKYKKEKFIVAIPRRAKSAATLISMGANEIHMGDLSELGPIDSQINNLPALGVYDALKTLAKVVSQYPKSVRLFAHFLESKMNLELLGWLTRIPESASQYAQKLLLINNGKKNGKTSNENEEEIKKIAKKFVEGYKDHGFVIDSEEAKIIFGNEIGEGLIHEDSSLMGEIENFYSDLSFFEFCINAIWVRENCYQSIEIVGDPATRLIEIKKYQ